MAVAASSLTTEGDARVALRFEAVIRSLGESPDFSFRGISRFNALDPAAPPSRPADRAAVREFIERYKGIVAEGSLYDAIIAETRKPMGIA